MHVTSLEILITLQQRDRQCWTSWVIHVEYKIKLQKKKDYIYKKRLIIMTIVTLLSRNVNLSRLSKLQLCIYKVRFLTFAKILGYKF